MERNHARGLEMPGVTTMNPPMKLWTLVHRDACRDGSHRWDIFQAHGCYDSLLAAFCTDHVVDSEYPHNDRKARDHDDDLGAFEYGLGVHQNEVGAARSFDLLD